MNNKKQISASVMCADLLNLSDSINDLEKNGVDFLHIDIMDGHFVPNITLGIDLCNAIGTKFNMKRDIHMLVKHPDIYLDRLQLHCGDMFSVHYEAVDDIKFIARKVRDKGVKFGIALNPETDINVLEDILDDLDFVVLMMVTPGFAGLSMKSGMLDKIFASRQYLDSKGKQNILIEVDGNVGFESARLMSEASADLFVAGSSSIFHIGETISSGVKKLRQAIEL